MTTFVNTFQFTSAHHRSSQNNVGNRLSRLFKTREDAHDRPPVSVTVFWQWPVYSGSPKSVRSCPQYQRCKQALNTKVGFCLLKSFRHLGRRYASITWGLTSLHNNKYVLTVADGFSKCSGLTPTESVKAHAGVKLVSQSSFWNLWPNQVFSFWQCVLF